MHHLFDGNLHELGGVVGRGPLHAGRQEGLHLCHLGLDQLGSRHGVGSRSQLHGHCHGGLAVQARLESIAFDAQFDASHIPEAHGGAVGVGAQHHFAEFLGRRQLARHHDRGGGGGARGAGQVAQGATGDLLVLRGNRCVDRCNRQTEALELGRIHPHAHGTTRCKQLCLAHAVQTLDFRHHIAVHVVGNIVTRSLSGLGLEGQNHQEVAHGLVHAHAQGLYDLRQAGQHAGEAVLHVHLGQIGVGARSKGDGQSALTARRGGGFHIHQTLGAVDFALDQLQNGVRHGL
ncbi:hypothetical protein SDC9_130873 [bioreactor metagenome]|uniref:Uncharacterized protein n=1 Tax=bioreactor metagenome TaxID=1076179 RepID=A0A645D3C8_9ZZZZ